MGHTRFERARVIGARALQLSMGASSFLPTLPASGDPIDISFAEFESRVSPLAVGKVADALD
jgi:DNA-directed RNA polymerase subunit K/omega